STYTAPPTLSLPSFPTRRSSDLVGHRSQHHPIWMCLLRPCRELIGDRIVGRAKRLPIFFGVAGCHWHHLQRQRQQGEVWLTLKPDRKSTRLNSSHVSISYAVFCL